MILRLFLVTEIDRHDAAGAQPIWSERAECLPKYIFSAYWPILAMVARWSLFPQNKPLSASPCNTSMQAKALRPDPLCTPEITQATRPVYCSCLLLGSLRRVELGQHRPGGLILALEADALLVAGDTGQVLGDLL